ncbi:hypothetical protein CCHR01_01004 [Colletotrichum chrysophilum]|uniref:Uncharacterized protein n=1 Tax=Colletotrichum chrysophilum TaxID=1836956 RepID=A0AAD9AXF1_9PEZI|nr:hypothetical protein CCHR01_01004 [Colletotrichum chrysophilum]
MRALTSFVVWGLLEDNVITISALRSQLQASTVWVPTANPLRLSAKTAAGKTYATPKSLPEPTSRRTIVGEPQDPFVRAADDHVHPLAAPSVQSASPQTQPSARRASTSKEISFHRDLITASSAHNASVPNIREERRQSHYGRPNVPGFNMDEPVTIYPQQRICSICDRARAEPAEDVTRTDMRPSPAPTAARDVVPRPTGFAGLVIEMETPRLAGRAGLDRRPPGGTQYMTLRLHDVVVRRLEIPHRLPDGGRSSTLCFPVVDGVVRRLEASHRLPDVNGGILGRLEARHHPIARNTLCLGARCVDAAKNPSARRELACVSVASMHSNAWERRAGTMRNAGEAGMDTVNGDSFRVLFWLWANPIRAVSVFERCSSSRCRTQYQNAL